MITKLYLALMREKRNSGFDIGELVDIDTVVIDRDKPACEKILSFIKQVRNPYFFKVGNTPVRVSFDGNGDTLQKCMQNLLAKCT